MNKNTSHITLHIFSFCVIFLACNKPDTNEEIEKKENTLSSHETLVDEVKQNYANIVLASYEDSLKEAKRLGEEISLFNANPTAEGLTRLKQIWRDSREPYGQTEVYRFADGPIDADDGQPESLINAWPLDESYIDKVSYNHESDTNIINNLTDYPTLTKTTLERINEAEGTNEHSVMG